MPLTHLLLILAIVFVWGTNFVVIKWGLAELPPFLLASLRFLFSALPFLFFLKRPAVPWRHLVAVGLLLGVGQFGLLFQAMRADISAGMASLVVQTQVFFTIVLAVLWRGERPSPMQWTALALAVAGMALIGANLDSSVSLLGLSLVLGDALCWAGSNLVVRAAGRVDALAFMVWASVFAAPPLALLSLVFEGPAVIGQALSQASINAWGVVLWQAWGNTLFGYGAWNWLLARHPAATVTPGALLVPVFGMSASALAFHEALPGWKLGAAALVITGLALNVLASRPAAPMR